MVRPKITCLIHSRKFCVLRAHDVSNEYKGSVIIPTNAFKSFPSHSEAKNFARSARTISANSAKPKAKGETIKLAIPNQN